MIWRWKDANLALHTITSWCLMGTRRKLRKEGAAAGSVAKVPNSSHHMLKHFTIKKRCVSSLPPQKMDMVLPLENAYKSFPPYTEISSSYLWCWYIGVNTVDANEVNFWQSNANPRPLDERSPSNRQIASLSIFRGPKAGLLLRSSFGVHIVRKLWLKWTGILKNRKE